MAKKKATKRAAKKTAPDPKPTTNDQVAVMESLTPASAGWLAGVDERTLRSHAEIPRDEAGRYNALDLVRFVAARVPVAKLPDEQLERASIVGDILAYQGQAIHGVIAFLSTIKSRHGNPGLAAVAKHLLTYLSDLIEASPDHFRVPTSEEAATELRDDLAEIVKTRREDAILRQARAHLRAATVCDQCGRRRQGNQWIESPPPSGHEVFGGCCPKCEENPLAGRPSDVQAEAIPDEMILDDLLDEQPGKA